MIVELLVYPHILPLVYWFGFPIFRYWTYLMKVILSVPDEGYSRNMLCRPKLIFTFLILVNSNRNKTSLVYLVETKANILHITEVEIILSVCLFSSFTGFIFSFQKDIYNFPILWMISLTSYRSEIIKQMCHTIDEWSL